MCCEFHPATRVGISQHWRGDALTYFLAAHQQKETSNGPQSLIQEVWVFQDLRTTTSRPSKELHRVSCEAGCHNLSTKPSQS